MSAISEERNRHAQEVMKLENKRRNNIDEMRKSYKGIIKNKEMAHEETLDNIKKSNLEDKRDIVESFNVTIENNRERTKEKINQNNERKERELLELKKKFKKEKEEMKLGFQRELDQLKRSYESIISDKDGQLRETQYQNEYNQKYLSKKFDKRVEMVKEDYEERLVNIEKSHKADIMALQKQLRGES